MPEKAVVTREGETKAMFRIHIRGSIEAVWREITRTDAPIPAFFNSRMDVARLARGEKLAMRTPNGKYTGVVGEILELVPLRRFAYTFKFTNFDDPPCRVAIDLAEKDGGVEYTMTISELTPGTKSAKQMLQGGVLIANTLKHVIEDGRPSFGTRMLFTLFKLMEPFSPARCKSEHWPVS